MANSSSRDFPSHVKRAAWPCVFVDYESALWGEFIEAQKQSVVVELQRELSSSARGSAQCDDDDSDSELEDFESEV